MWAELHCYASVQETAFTKQIRAFSARAASVLAAHFELPSSMRTAKSGNLRKTGTYVQLGHRSASCLQVICKDVARCMGSFDGMFKFVRRAVLRLQDHRANWSSGGVDWILL
jgi:hypothetical protein